ncbi:MAG: hypothetical protein QM650_07620 [Microlunatus sp.]
MSDEIPGDVGAHWTLCREYAKSREWKSWWLDSEKPWLELRPSGVDDVSSVVARPLGRGYLVKANLTSLDAASVPLVLDFRRSNFVTQTQLDDFEVAARQAYKRIFSYVRDHLNLGPLPGG